MNVLAVNGMGGPQKGMEREGQRGEQTCKHNGFEKVMVQIPKTSRQITFGIVVLFQILSALSTY